MDGLTNVFIIIILCYLVFPLVVIRSRKRIFNSTMLRIDASSRFTGFLVYLSRRPVVIRIFYSIMLCKIVEVRLLELIMIPSRNVIQSGESETYISHALGPSSNQSRQSGGRIFYPSTTAPPDLAPAHNYIFMLGEPINS